VFTDQSRAVFQFDAIAFYTEQKVIMSRWF